MGWVEIYNINDFWLIGIFLINILNYVFIYSDINIFNYFLLGRRIFNKSLLIMNLKIEFVFGIKKKLVWVMIEWCWNKLVWRLYFVCLIWVFLNKVFGNVLGYISIILINE